MKPVGFRRNVGGALMEGVNVGKAEFRYLQQSILFAKNG